MIQLENYIAGEIQNTNTGYKYFLPRKINTQWAWNNEINILLEKASIKLGELNSFANFVPNIDLFIKLHVTKEAVISSRIEGTQTAIDEALLNEKEISPERKDDWQEVNNYINALNYGIENLEKLPICSRLIKRIHKILLGSVRGESKQPGEFRKSQNWIGGSSPSDAVFVPPHHQHLDELLSDLENFINNQDIKIPLLVKIAIVHYQFETIHPFLDGNGRIGRLLIPLFLVEHNILTKPLLYLSTYFEKNKSLYYDNLTFVRTKNDMQQWIKYFLVGIEQTAIKSIQTLNKVLELKLYLEAYIINNFGKKISHANILLQYLFKNPIVYVQNVQEITELSYKSSNNLVSDFIKANILLEITGKNRNRLFEFKAYVDLF